MRFARTLDKASADVDDRIGRQRDRVGAEVIALKRTIGNRVATRLLAVLFVYAFGRRLSIDGDEASFLAWIYERSERGVGVWRLLGWESDEYGEFAGFAELPDGRGTPG